MTRSRSRREPEFDWEDPRPFAGAAAPGQPEPATAPLTAIRVRGPQLPAFPALDVDTGPMRRMPNLRALQLRERPARPADAFIPVWSPVLGQFIMLCGTCPPERRSRYADPMAGHMPPEFEALRVSAYVSGWRLDAFARWACPACQQTPGYRTPYPVIQWDGDATEAYLAGDGQGERYHRDAAEHDLVRTVAAASRHGRHAEVTS